ncbi:MAG: DNA polymerase III subunit epsilon [Sterolibacterium sp.]|nr:DNA polymerase III subunit epsilon [Sterolibacterium sp.]MBP9799054.1 DNA polymerase III subunit epsilon [Sterolibacterium sp.]
MRQVVLDTETTGTEYKQGDRVVEIGCVELVDRKLTRSTYHTYLNPDCQISAKAQEIHGLSSEFLADKPRFAEVAEEFLAFIQGAELLIHNAEFDRGFLDNELSLLGRPPLRQSVTGIVDTLKMARDMRPGRRNTLDALCKEFGVDNSGRTLHGALLDAELLADVYLAMTRGQGMLLMEAHDGLEAGRDAAQQFVEAVTGQPALIVLRATAKECEDHERVLAEIAKESKGQCVWQAVSGH